MSVLLPDYRGDVPYIYKLVRALTDILNRITVKTDLLASGTYTPTLTDDAANCSPAPSVNGPFQYMRVGNTVTVSGSMSVDPIGASLTKVGISLPIPATFTANYQCAGTGSSISGDVTNGVVIGSSGGAQFWWTPTGFAARNIWVHFTYSILTT